MSVAATINRLARVVRAEAKRNPEFAARLDAVFLAHRARIEAGAGFDPEEFDPADAGAPQSPAVEPPPVRPEAPTDLNPVALLSEGGEAALLAALSGPAWSRDTLIALAREHNLDPAGEAEALDAPALIEHLVAQAGRRVARDRKLFDY